MDQADLSQSACGDVTTSRSNHRIKTNMTGHVFLRVRRLSQDLLPLIGLTRRRFHNFSLRHFRTFLPSLVV